MCKEIMKLSRKISIYFLTVMLGILGGILILPTQVVNAEATVTIGNHGYPYGKDMTGGITFVIDTTVSENTTYQWYVSTDSGASYTQVAGKSGSVTAGATSISTTFLAGDFTENAWYKCRIGNNEADETYPVQAYKSGDYYYISNGQMGYRVWLGDQPANQPPNPRFDVIGKYKGTWVTKTSYDSYWQWYTSTESNPAAENAASGTRPNSSATISSNKVYFLKNDYTGAENNSQETASHTMIFETTIGADQHAFCFGCDVMVRSNDKAPCTGVFGLDGSLKQIQLVDAASLEAATDESAALVVNTNYSNPTKWYIGYWKNRKKFGFGEQNDPNNANYADYYTYDASGHVSQVTGTDSGITASYTGLEAGATIAYAFNLGTVAQTGAVTGKVNYTDETLDDLDPTTTYEITIDGEEPPVTYTITSDENGSIKLSGTDEDGKPYDFIGKKIKVRKKKQNQNDPEGDPLEVEIAGRPDAEEAESTGQEGTDYVRPGDVTDSIISATETTITLDIPAEDAKKLSQEYRIYTKDGEEITGKGWVKPAANGQVVFTDLETGTEYLIKARIPATTTTPASETTPGVKAKTIARITVTEPTNLVKDYDGEVLSPVVTADEGAVVTYSNSLSQAYGNNTPQFVNGGKYTVYYKVTKDECQTVYGNYEVIINPLVTYDANGGVLAENTPEPFIVAYGNKIADDKIAANPTKDGYDFAGWYTNKNFTIKWSFDNKVVQNTTLYAKWVESAYKISGNVKDTNNDPVVTADVALRKGNNIIATTTSGADGKYSIDSVPDGEYNLVISKGDRVVTKLVVVSGKDVSVTDAIIPAAELNSVVDVKENTPDVVVGGLDEAVNNAEVVSTNPGDKVTVTLTVEAEEDLTTLSDDEKQYIASSTSDRMKAKKEILADQESILEKATEESGKETVLDFIDMSLIKTVINGASVTTGKITDTKDNVLEIVVPYAVEGKKSINVFRCHEGNTVVFSRLKSRPTSDYKDATFYVGADYIVIYTNKFSGYAISYLTELAKAPELGDLKGNNVSEEGKKDGSIEGVDDTMEYSEDGGKTWKEVPKGATKIEGLGKGDVLVRYKAHGNNDPSEATTVTIGVNEKKSDDESDDEFDDKLDRVVVEFEKLVNYLEDLTDEQKKAFIDKIDNAYTTGKGEIKDGKSTEEKEAAYNKAVEAMKAAYSEALKSEIETRTDAAKKAIDNNKGLTDKQKKEFKDELDKAATKAMGAVKSVVDTMAVNSAKENSGTAKPLKVDSDLVDEILAGLNKDIDAVNTKVKSLTSKSIKVSAKEQKANALMLNSKLKVDQKGNVISIKWGKVKKADGYNVYVQYCGKKFTNKPAKEIKNKNVCSVKIKKINGKRLNRKKNYKVYVKAYKKKNGVKVELGKSITAHVVGTQNKKFTNVKDIKITSHTNIDVYASSPYQITAKTILVDKSKKQLSDAHAAEFRYASSNESVATVSKSGLIKGVKPGKCTIYVYARNGYAKTVKVTVKK